MKNTSGDRSAFPIVINDCIHERGIPVRTYLAAAAMQGMLAGKGDLSGVFGVARDAVALADALLARISAPVAGVVMPFIEAPMGCRFRYVSPKSDRVWIKLGIEGCGTIAEYDPRFALTRNWNGQQFCSFADTEEQMRTLEIEVLS